MSFPSGILLGCLLTFGHLINSLVLGVTYQLAEESVLDTIIGNVSEDSGLKDMLGGDEFANLRYSILSGGNQNNVLFKISSLAGVLRVGNRIDREAVCPFTDTCEINLEIAAQSSGSFFRNIKVKIVITDINDNAPAFPQPFVHLNVSEAVAIGFFLTLEPAVDLDASKNFTVVSYSITPERVPFGIVYSVNPVGIPQLSLKVNGQLDREAQANYNLTVTAYDGGEPPRSGSVTVRIRVLDVNDNSPQFSANSYMANISESAHPGTPILTVSAMDKDEGENSEIRYSVSGQQPTSEQQKLSIDPVVGIITLAQNLKIGLHRVLIEASDQGNPPKSNQAVVEVSVLDTDNNPPELNLNLLSVLDNAPGSVPESAKVSTPVAFLAVSDPDATSGANGLVTCNSGSSYFDVQHLDVDEYKIIISSPLDREKDSHHTVFITCSDGGTPRLTSSVIFDVWVVDVNDNPPVFLQKDYSASVAENNGASDGLLQVAATDADAGNNGNVTYRLSPEALGHFQIGLTNGMVKATHSFDFEEMSQYVLYVLAVDQGSPALTGTATVTINILDINDEAPRFSAQEYNYTVPENEMSGLYVGNVSASDPDTGMGGLVTVSLLQPAGVRIPFAISQTGIITTTNILDREQMSVYTFSVVAVDGGIQPLTSTAVVKIIVLDVNDNSPIFIYPSNFTEEVFIPVGADYIVSSVKAIDADADHNSMVSYRTIGGNASVYFRVDSYTGAVKTLIDFDEANTGVYQLVVRATDQGDPPRHTDQLFKFTVRNQNQKINEVLSDHYILIVICIAAFTVVVSAAVITTLCILRKLDQDRKLKYSAGCCPDARDDHGFSLNSSADYHQQVPTVSEELNRKPDGTGSFSDSAYGSSDIGETGSMGLAPQGVTRFPLQRSTNQRSSYSKFPIVQEQQARKTPALQTFEPPAIRRADDFHSTSSTETTTGDSGHGSDDDFANHSLDRPLSPPNQLTVGVRTSGSPSFNTFSSKSARLAHNAPKGMPPESSRPIQFVQRGQLRNSGSVKHSVRFSPTVTFDSSAELPSKRRICASVTDSFREEDSDLNTTTSGSYSVGSEDSNLEFRDDDSHYENHDYYNSRNFDMVV